MDHKLHHHMLKNLVFKGTEGIFYKILGVSLLNSKNIITFYKVSEPDELISMYFDKFNEVKENKRVYEFVQSCCGDK